MRRFPYWLSEELSEDWKDKAADYYNEMGRRISKVMEDHPLYGKAARGFMKTDVVRKDSNYEITADLPGFRKDEIRISLEDGYLIIRTNREKKAEERAGDTIRRERYTGNMARSFYVGEDVKKSDIHAEFRDGVLKVIVPIKEETKEQAAANDIEIN